MRKVLYLENKTAIPVEVYENQLEEFFASLAYIKQNYQKDIADQELLKATKKLASSIHCHDASKLEAERYIEQARQVLVTLYMYLKKSERYSADYREVAKGDLTDFAISDFGNRLFDILCGYFPLFIEKRSPLESYMLVRNSLVRTIGIRQQVHSWLMGTLEAEICEKYNIEKGFRWEFVEDKVQSLCFILNGNIKITLEAYYWIKEKGFVEYRTVAGNPEYLRDCSEQLYFSLGQNIVSIEENSDMGSVICRHYQNTIAIEELKNIPDNTDEYMVSIDQIDMTDFDTYLKTLLKYRNTVLLDSIITLGELYSTSVDAETSNKYERVEFLKEIVKELFGLIADVYPNITLNTKTIIVGVICSELGFFKSENDYIINGGKQSYREYLKSSVKNLIRYS